MIQILEMLQSFATEWLVVITILLGVAFLMQCLIRNHLLKQRTGEFGIACVLLWTVLALVPLPRWSSQLTVQQSPISSGSPMEELASQFNSNNLAIAQVPLTVAETNFRDREELHSIAGLGLKLPAKSGQFDWEPHSRNTLAPMAATPNIHSTQAWMFSDKKSWQLECTSSAVC